MPPRRSHKKSRHGCLTCKQRRVKCSEDGQPCRICVAREIECVYVCPSNAVAKQLTITTVPAPHVAMRTSITPRFTAAPPQIPSYGFSARSEQHVNELLLLNRWQMDTYLSLALTASEAEHWRSIITPAAIQHSFFLNEIFAFTALHVHSQTQEPSLLRRALEYHQAACSSFQEYTTGLTRENCIGVWGFKVINVLFTLAVPQWSQEHTYPSSIVAFAKLLHGLATIWRQGGSWLKATLPVKTLRAQPSSKGVGVGSEDRLVLSRMFCLNARQAGSGDDADTARLRKAYFDTIVWLETACASMLTALDELIIWPFGVPQDIYNALERGEALALMILLHWGTMLHRAAAGKNKWWTRSLGRCVVEAMVPCILAKQTEIPEYVDLAQWAKEVVGMEY